MLWEREASLPTAYSQPTLLITYIAKVMLKGGKLCHDANFKCCYTMIHSNVVKHILMYG